MNEVLFLFVLFLFLFLFYLLLKQQTEEAENESLLKMELMFLQKKYDKEVKARMQLQKALIEYKKTIENLVGLFSPHKKKDVIIKTSRISHFFFFFHFLTLSLKDKKETILRWKKS